MPRKKTETTAPVAEANSKKKPSTAKKANRSRETKEKPTTAKKQRTKKTEVETVVAEIVDNGNKKKKGCGVNGNLIPFSERTENEQREIRQKGGIESGKARREKKSLREFGKDFLMQTTSPVFHALMETHQVEENDMTNAAALFVRMFNKAMSTGDLNAARQVVEWAGMAPLQEMRENEAVARMSQVIQLASGTEDENAKGDDDVVFYIPENGRKIITDDDLVTVSE